jgi:hypothetical protein
MVVHLSLYEFVVVLRFEVWRLFPQIFSTKSCNAQDYFLSTSAPCVDVQDVQTMRLYWRSSMVNYRLTLRADAS